MSTPTSSRLTTASDVIDALGGTQAVADLLAVGASAISNYRRQGFPARVHFKLARICQQRGLDVAEAVFGGPVRPSRQRPTALTPAPRDQRDPLLQHFEAAGFDRLSTPVLQPAAPFIDRLGEEMRRRLYMFTDPAGDTVCLRPDLTIPTALHYLSEGLTAPMAYCYQGLAFRYQPRGAGKPEEFLQTGLELIGGPAGPDTVADDARVMRQILDALAAEGVGDVQIVVNHLGMFSALLESLDLTGRARQRLERAYHQSADFDGFLAQLSRESAAPARPAVAAPQGDDGLEIAGRSLADIRTRLDRLREDAATRIAPEAIAAITQYMTLTGPVAHVMQQLAAHAPMQRYTDYWQGLADAGIELDRLTLATAHGRKMAYYTGLAFEVHVPALGPQRVIASGGRYDDLLQSLGAPQPLAAIGGALASERVRAAAQLSGGQK